MSVLKMLYFEKSNFKTKKGSNNEISENKLRKGNLYRNSSLGHIVVYVEVKIHLKRICRQLGGLGQWLLFPNQNEKGNRKGPNVDQIRYQQLFLYKIV